MPPDEAGCTGERNEGIAGHGENPGDFIGRRGWQPCLCSNILVGGFNRCPRMLLANHALTDFTAFFSSLSGSHIPNRFRGCRKLDELDRRVSGLVSGLIPSLDGVLLALLIVLPLEVF